MNKKDNDYIHGMLDLIEVSVDPDARCYLATVEACRNIRNKLDN